MPKREVIERYGTMYTKLCFLEPATESGKRVCSGVIAVIIVKTEQI